MDMTLRICFGWLTGQLLLHCDWSVYDWLAGRLDAVTHTHTHMYTLERKVVRCV